MLLTPTELERLTIYTAAELARKRKAKGLVLNYPEAVAYITDEILEAAREGRSVAELIAFGSTLLTTDDVMPGVQDLIPMIQVEGTFPDGTKRFMIRSDRAEIQALGSTPVKWSHSKVISKSTAGEGRTGLGSRTQAIGLFRWGVIIISSR